MIFEDDIIECIIELKRIYKYIFLDDVGLYFFDISGHDEKSDYEYKYSEGSSKYTTGVTKKCKTSDNTSTKMNDEKKYNSKTEKVRTETNEPRGEARRKYRRKQDCVGRITA